MITINCSLKDINTLADLIADIDMANAGIGENDIRASVEKAHALLEEMAGEFAQIIYAKEDYQEIERIIRVVNSWPSQQGGH